MSALPLLNRFAPRRAVISALNANFNANLAAFAASGYYNQSNVFTIDFTGASGNYAEADIEDFENSPITSFPGLCIFTADDKDQGSPKGFRWFGPVLLGARFCVRYRSGAEAAIGTEVTFDWIADAFMATINDPSIQWPAGVIYDRQSGIQKAKRLLPLADGWQLIIEFGIPFTVGVN